MTPYETTKFCSICEITCCDAFTCTLFWFRDSESSTHKHDAFYVEINGWPFPVHNANAHLKHGIVTHALPRWKDPLLTIVIPLSGRNHHWLQFAWKWVIIARRSLSRRTLYLRGNTLYRMVVAEDGNIFWQVDWIRGHLPLSRLKITSNDVPNSFQRWQFQRD